MSRLLLTGRMTLLVALVLGTASTGAVVGCATERPYVWIQDLPPIPVKNDGFVHSRDTIVIAVRDQPTMSGEFVVRDDGGVFMPTVGDVVVANRTTADITAELSARVKDMIVKPMVAVSIAKVASIRVSVVGQVKTAGSYELTRDRSITAALAAAGWLTEFASRDRIFLMRRGERDLRVRFQADQIVTPDPSVSRFVLNDGDVVVAE